MADPEKTERALRGLLEAIEGAELIGQIDAGCMGQGPVVEAFVLLDEPFPDWVKAYLGEEFLPIAEEMRDAKI